MTVKELKEILDLYDDDRQITVKGCSCPYTHDIKHVLVNQNDMIADQNGELVIFPDA